MVDPIFIVIALMTGSLVFKRVRKKFIVTGIVLLFFFSNPFIINQILSLWEKQAVNFQKLNKPKYKYGIVLTGMLNYHYETGNVNFLRSSDRIWQAIDLYEKGKIEKLFISGGAVGLIYRDTIESAYLKKYLVQLGIPDSVIKVEDKSRNTFENAFYTCTELKKDSISPDDCLLITSAIHIRRASACFARQGFVIDQYPVDHYSDKPDNFIIGYLLPSVNAIWQWSSLMHEWLGYFSYKISGYL